ncbi:repressor [Burkholderia ubonensis]|uniref:LexA family protein n=1 Tax=Burkholderia ubonensis TaxID=101571 RepID=UPI000755F6B4|nr:translesion error-prone DNA polymerase V autoproteolytic subunit [Burkholderia ubonensis]KVP96743.1 repressor [Burkholderia ubonensis]
MSSLPVPVPPDLGELLAVDAKVPAGFPSPAQDHTQKRVDLNEVLVLNPLSTFLFQVAGDSMIGEGIFDGDRVIVDRSIEAMNGYIVLACVDGEFTVKKLERRAGRVRLLSANPRFHPIEFREGQELTIWGVVTWNLRQLIRLKGLPATPARSARP